MSNMKQAAAQRIKAIKATSEEHRHALAQHLTPSETAMLAVSMFSASDHELSCLDIGAGTGMLSVALVERYPNQIHAIDCIEVDPVLAKICDEDLVGVNHQTIVADVLTSTPEKRYDRVILNPPYKKMASDDPRQASLPVRSANLYSAFLAIALEHLAPTGEVVAIIPRSWMNGDYFTPFRNWALNRYSLDAMHIYGSRTEIFEDTDVLQETMIVRFSNRKQTNKIEVSHSLQKRAIIKRQHFAPSELITDDARVIRIAPQRGKQTATISERGFCPSTGKVVDFRSRERIYMTKQEAITDAAAKEDIYRLVYAGNLRTGKLIHPADIGKCQWYRADDKSTTAQLIQPGSYVLVKRFSAKEETRRVVSYPITIEEPIAFENHTNFIHAGSPRKVVPLDSADIAKGISVWLNSSYIDEWFRDVSGSTQVNAKDIKAMPCPNTEDLVALGKVWQPKMTQESIDELVKDLV